MGDLGEGSVDRGGSEVWLGPLALPLDVHSRGFCSARKCSSVWVTPNGADFTRSLYCGRPPDVGGSELLGVPALDLVFFDDRRRSIMEGVSASF